MIANHKSLRMQAIDLMTHLDWSPAQLAKEVGIDRQSVWRYLEGHHDAGSAKAEQMLEALQDAASVTFVLDLPPVFAHNTGHWRTKSKKIKSMRAEAAAACKKQKPFGKATVYYDFFFPDRRVRDEANYIHGCKPYMDGLVDGGFIKDDRWTFLSTGGTTSRVSKAKPRVEITLLPTHPMQG